ncbi:MAG: T9SS type A sorting domain-containing protein, partial [Flavobacteriales bacterium]|nr:T9SS type A sorting domain-containing protein [Flavobacteriales bacterium]
WVGPFTFATPPCMPIALNLGADTTVCSTDTLTLDAGAGSYIYNWSFGATTQIVNLDTSIFGGNGTYTIIVVVTDFNTGCVYQDDINVTFSTCVGLDENASLVDFNIYPNPNKGQFTIKLNNKNTTELRISVTNVQGQEVFVKNNFDNVNVINEQINIGDVKGIYFVNIITNKEVVTKKVIVQ